MIKNIIPSFYKINLQIDDINFYNNSLKYNGTVTIIIDIKNETDIISLNSKNININSITFNNIKCCYDSKDDILNIKSDNKFSVGNHTLIIVFDNIITEDLEGIYYTKSNNSLIITTHMEPIYARKVFPCFDDPSLKAIFQLTVKTLTEYNCISNTNIIATKNISKDIKKIKFDKTPIMSTYLFCFVLGNIVPTSEEPLITKNGTLVNGYSIKDTRELMNFSIKHTVKAIEYYEEWFDIKYILPKLDIVSIPNFDAGAMENWGIVTFREHSILCNDGASDFYKFNIINTIFHEIAHQWFGNLVTLSKWDDLWLNESNATFFSWIAMYNLYKEYIPECVFYNHEYSHALIYDSFKNTHPIVSKNNNPVELFDEISYNKGACLINYMADLTGIDDFKNGIQKYLKLHKFKNTSSEDYYKLVNSNNFEMIKKLLETSGYPLINLKINNNILKITIQKFNHKSNERYESDFMITYENDNVKKYLLINKDYIEIKINNTDFLFNKSNKFLCVINYSNFFPCLKMMNNDDILSYINNNFLLFRSSIINYKEYFNRIKFILNNYTFSENSILIIIQILKNINLIFEILDLKNKCNIFHKNNIIRFLKLKIIKIMNYFVCSKNKIYYLKELIEEFLEMNCIHFENKKYINIVYKIYKNNNKCIFTSILKTIIKYDINEFCKIYKMGIDSDIITKNDILYSLTHTTSEINFIYLLNNYKKVVKKQDYYSYFYSLSKNKLFQKKVIEFIMNKYNESNEKKTFIHILCKISVNIYNENEILSVLNFLEKINSKEHFLTINKIRDILDFNTKIF